MKNSIKVATLNVRSIDKVSNQTATRNFLKFLKSQRIDILALQETNIQPIELTYSPLLKKYVIV
mgnify:CR=1 FL=1